MSDIGGVGGGRASESGKSKKKKKVDPEAFREMMKVGKAREVDPEEKKKRKTPQEAQEDMVANQTEDAQQDPETTAPSPYETTSTSEPTMTGTEDTTLSTEETSLGAPPPGASSEEEFAPPPSIKGYETEAPTSAGSSYEVTPSAPAPQPEAAQEPTQTLPTQEPSQPQTQQSTTTQQTQPDSSDQTQQTTPTSQTDTGADTGSDSGDQDQGAGALLSISGPEKTEETQAKLQLEEVTKGKAAEQTAAESGAEAIPGSPSGLMKGGWEASRPTDEEEKKLLEGEKAKKIQMQDMPQTEMQMTPDQPAEISAPTGAQASPYAQLPPHVMALFERMVGVMTVMHAAGVTETSINLSNPQFAKSPFFGSEIVIREYATAPKEFNIEMLGTQQSANLFAGHSQELLAAFQHGNYNFKVNRIDVGYIPEKKEERVRKEQKVRRKQTGGGL